jgi:hypothetical protein
MQNKLYLIAVIALILGAGAVAWTYLETQTETVPIMAPLAELNANTAPTEPATVMTDDERRAALREYAAPTIYFFPNEYDQGGNEDATDAPPPYQHLLSIPFHNAKSVLRVYANVICPVTLNQSGDCLGDDLVIVKYDPVAKISMKIATIASFHGGNYGGIFVPLALTKDDKNIVLKAWMGSPGAGGGAVDLGYSKILLTAKAETFAGETLPHLASAAAVFYDSYGKVVSLEESNRTFDWSQPGRNPNQGAVIYRDLVSGEAKTLADGADTSYEIRGFDEQERVLSLQLIRYSFDAECPRADKTLNCANRTATNIAIRVP